ncbi:hypothetical protein CI109_107189 [Kwoniella shandongensis]|uniref:Ribosome biogenesis protein NOP53 n=1 Tax=Kwoniella shandongensis TaxID=1734106 RepID=A0A5M6C316_9TREE|nr:uncharacterized protein CI109_002472 [Kwoniella shandongensis]KAA5529131.1 hypothetical protein CI109_002472 [Kwoniella shandongensis]
MARTTSSKSSTTQASKPYDRPAASTSSKAAKGKGKALPASTKSNELGAPSTLSQASRKGKKAWRKNIDIGEEEEALEQGREEERVTGGRVAAKSNDQLFTVDVVGDVEVAKRAKRAHKPLRSLAVLQERSAVPSFTARPTTVSSSASHKKKSNLTAAEKERLRRIARRTTAYSDGTGQTSASITKRDPSAVEDVWTESADVVEEVQMKFAKGGFAEETIVKRKVKTPITIQRQREVYLEKSGKATAEEIPETGTSYNPSAETHAKLMKAAVEEELEALKKEEELDQHLKKLGGVIEARKTDKFVSEFAAGMLVGDGEVGSDEEEGEDSEVMSKKPSKRKTQAQRNKALRQKAIEETLKAEKERRKLVNSVSSVAAFKKEVERRAKELMEKEEAAKLAKKEKERMLLKGGEKVGKYRVAKKRVEVQLGEDLAESLRQIKPEGNLFKDRFLALQKRALIEPRVPVMPRRTNRTKEYEKFSYKRFQ